MRLDKLDREQERKPFVRPIERPELLRSVKISLDEPILMISKLLKRSEWSAPRHELPAPARASRSIERDEILKALCRRAWHR